MALGNGQHRIEVARQSGHMHRNDRPRTRRNGRLDLVKINIAGIQPDIHEHRAGPGSQDRVAERAHMRQRRGAARGHLRVELLRLLVGAVFALQLFVSEAIDRFVSHNFSLVSPP